MNPILVVFLALLGALFTLIAIMLVRTALCKPNETKKQEATLHDVDENEVARHLADAVRIPTVSLKNLDEDGTVFYRYHDFLEKTYPVFHQTATKEIVNKYTLFYTIKGKNPSLKPGCFLAHQDVVPAVNESEWSYPPFSGTITDGYVYGRGAQDMKSQMIALLDAMETLLKEGFVPDRDLYFIFGHDEEPNTSDGAPVVSKLLKERGIELEFVVDEGGTIVDGKVIGVNKIIGLIGTCEKGYVDIKLTATKDGGHASNPRRPSSISIIGKAIYEIEKHPSKTKWTKSSIEMFRYLAPYMPFAIRFVFANRDILSPLIKFVLSKAHPVTNSIVRTTYAPTTCKGSNANNVIPKTSTANVNCRVLTGETTDETLARIQKIAGKNVICEKVGTATEPTKVSNTDSKAYADLTKSISEAFPELVLAPYPFIAGTDSRYFYPVCENVFRFTPFLVSLEDQNRIHGIDERASIEGLKRATQFFIACIENMSKE